MKKDTRKIPRKTASENILKMAAPAPEAALPVPMKTSAALVAAAQAAPSREEIAARAQAIWRAAGCPSGRDVEHWLEAEAQLQTESRVA